MTAIQLHHDQQIRTMREFWLKRPNQQEFRAAKAREEQGEVAPLVMDCLMAKALIDQYFLIAVPSADDEQLRMREDILQDVLASHIEPRGGTGCARCEKHFKETQERHMYE